MEVVVVTRSIRRATLQSKCHHQQANTVFLQARCPSCCPTNSVSKHWREKFNYTNTLPREIQQCKVMAEHCAIKLHFTQQIKCSNKSTVTSHNCTNNWYLQFITCKMLVLVCWWLYFDSNSARLTAPVVTITSTILSSNKIQNGDILVLGNPGPTGKWPLTRRGRERNMQNVKWRPCVVYSHDLYYSAIIDILTHLTVGCYQTGKQRTHVKL